MATLCEEVSPVGLRTGQQHVHCTRPLGHDGDHMATIGPAAAGGIVLAQWAPGATTMIEPDYSAGEGFLPRTLTYEPVPADDAVFRLQQRIQALEQRLAALEAEARAQREAAQALGRAFSGGRQSER